MKKLLALCLSLLLTFSSFNVVVNAEENELPDYIVSGDGTFENPYILRDDNNEVAQFIIQNYNEKMNNSNQGNSRIFTGSCPVDDSKNISSLGSHWVSTTSYGDVNTNGSLSISLIDYSPHDDVADNLALLVLNSSPVSTLRDIAIGSYDTDTAIAMVKNSGVKTAKSVTGFFLPSIGYLAAIYGGLQSFASLSSAIEGNVLATAQITDKSVMTVHYKTSYNGAWYSHSRMEVGDDEIHPQIPSTSINLGIYRNYPRVQ